MFGWLGQIVIKFTFLNVGPLHAASGRQSEFSSIYSMVNLSCGSLRASNFIFKDLGHDCKGETDQLSHRRTVSRTEGLQ